MFLRHQSASSIGRHSVLFCISRPRELLPWEFIGGLIRENLEGRGGRVDWLLQHLADRFELKAVLGSGAFATVYRAFDMDLEREVALKVLHAETTMDPDSLLRFEREAKTLCALAHPNIVRVLSFGLAADRFPYMVSEFLEGKSLREVLTDSGGLSVRETERLTLEICKGLQFMHEHAVVHRDLKPENVFVCSNGDVKLIDLGLCGFLAGSEPGALNLTSTGMVVGTVSHMSPEQVRGEKLDGRSDIYSLGCIVYECLTGTTPFVADNQFAIMMQQTSVEPDWKTLESCAPIGSTCLIEVLKTALHKDRQKRFLCANELAAAVDSKNYHSQHAWTLQAPGTTPKLLLATVLIAVAFVVASLPLITKQSPPAAKLLNDPKLSRRCIDEIHRDLIAKEIDAAVVACERLSACSHDERQKARSFLDTAWACIRSGRDLAAHKIIRRISDPNYSVEVLNALNEANRHIVEIDVNKAKELVGSDIVWLRQNGVPEHDLFPFYYLAGSIGVRQPSSSSETIEYVRKASTLALQEPDILLGGVFAMQSNLARMTRTPVDAERFLYSLSSSQRKRNSVDAELLRAQCDLMGGKFRSANEHFKQAEKLAEGAEEKENVRARISAHRANY